MFDFTTTSVIIVAINVLVFIALWIKYTRDKASYIAAVKLELFKLQCPYYDSRMVLSDYVNGVSPEAAARRLAACWVDHIANKE